MTDLGPLYHWSPRTKFTSIKRLGLVPGRRGVRGPVYHDPDDESLGEYRQDSVSFSPDPATAWSYSHAVFKVPGIYDLWQVWLIHSDEVRVLPMWGSHIVEVRVSNRIPKSRLVWVGEREISPPSTSAGSRP